MVIESVLRRLARRCEIHDRPTPLIIRELEEDLGVEPSPVGGDFVDQHADPRLIDCRHGWCRSRSSVASDHQI